MQLLIVGISEDESLLLVRELERGGYDVAFERVMTQKGLSDAFDKTKWDVAISGCIPQEVNGRTALEILREKDPDLPFILVSDRIGEESVAEAMKAGVNDFILKDNLSRLVPAVKQAICEAEAQRKHRQEEESLREREWHYRILAEESLVGVYIIQDNKFVYVNPRFAEMMGYEREEIIGKLSPEDLAAPESRELIAENIRRRMEGEVSSVHYTLKGLRKDGTVIDEEVLGSVAVYHGKPAIIGLSIDITERKKAEEALKETESMYRILTEESLVGVYIIQDEKFIYVNPRYAEMHGYTPDEVIGKGLIDFAAPESRHIIEELIRRRMSGDINSVHYIIKGLRKDGSVFDKEVLGTYIVYRGKPAVLGSVLDITERKKVEERRKELERQQRQFYRQTIFSATGGKLIISEPEEIAELYKDAVKIYPLKAHSDLEGIRSELKNVAMAYGMTEQRAEDFVLCVGEASTNAIKHADGGEVALIYRGDRIYVHIADKGPGIDALTLPRVTLEKGYSSGKSLGMGYSIILDLSDEVFLHTGPTGTTVVIGMDVHEKPVISPIDTLPDTW